MTKSVKKKSSSVDCDLVWSVCMLVCLCVCW